MTTIEINWEGPCSLEKVKDFERDYDYGIYQIYGTHNIFGPNSLLYIGQANDQTFARRISQHKEWTDWEFSDVQVYVGRLGSIDPKSNDKWGELIDNAERLLIYHSSPPYNSASLNSYGDIKDTIVFNFGKKNNIPLEVSSLYHESRFWDKDTKWLEYKDEK